MRERQGNEDKQIKLMTENDTEVDVVIKYH